MSGDYASPAYMAEVDRRGAPDPLFFAAGRDGAGDFHRAEGKTEQEAVEKWTVLARRGEQRMADWNEDLSNHGQHARALADRWFLTDGPGDVWGQPVEVGQVVAVWGHGRYRRGVVTRVTKTGKRATVLWFSPADLRNGQRYGHRTEFSLVAIMRSTQF